MLCFDNKFSLLLCLKLVSDYLKWRMSKNDSLDVFLPEVVLLFT